MSLPPQLPPENTGDAEWRRRVRDAVNRLMRFTMGVGVTVERPPSPTTGQQFFDQTLNRPIWWTGTAWINAAGVVV